MSRTLGLAGTLIGLSACNLVLTTPTSPTHSAATDSALPTSPTVEGATVAAEPAPEATPAAVTEPQPDYFREAVNRASSAVAIGQSAQSTDDWKLAVSRWQQAIDLLQKVPGQSPDYAQAQTKIQEYQQHLNSAEQRAQGKPLIVPAAAPAEPQLPDGLVAQIPIRARQGGTPIVSVSLQGQRASQSYPMLFDTGATGTLITPEMAHTLGVTIIGETQARIADGSVVSLPVGRVDVLEVGGLHKEGVQVAIGGNVALLGQNVYGDYGIAIGSHMIHLHP